MLEVGKEACASSKSLQGYTKNCAYVAIGTHSDCPLEGWVIQVRGVRRKYKKRVFLSLAQLRQGGRRFWRAGDSRPVFLKLL